MLSDSAHEQIIRRAVLHRLMASKKLDQTKLDQMMAVARDKLCVSLLPGYGPGSGWSIREQDVSAFVAEMEKRPGFLTAEAQADTAARPPSSNASEWSEDEFRRLPPIERLKMINKRVARDGETIHRVYDASNR